MTECPIDTQRLRWLLANSGWLFSWLAVQVTGLVMTLTGETSLQLSTPLYVTGAVGSALFWWFLAELSGELRTTWVRLVYAALIGCATAVLVVVGSGLYWKFGSFGTPSIALAVRPETAARYIAAYASIWITIGFLVLWAITTIAWFISMKRRTPDKRWRTALASLLVAAGLVASAPHAGSILLPPDVAALSTLGFISTQETTALSRPDPRTPVTPSDQQIHDWNIVLICHDTWTTRWVRALNGNGETRFPKMTKWTDRERKQDRGLWFHRHLTTSVWTEFALPTLLAGTGLEEGLSTLHRRPLLWEWYKKAGFRTGFFSSQFYRVAGIHNFLFSREQPDRLETLSTIKSNTWIFRPDGVDNLQTARLAADFIESTPADKPLFLFAMSNAMHHPPQTSSPLMDALPGGLSPREKGARVVDQFTVRIVRALRQTGRLDRTFVVILGDHGRQNPDIQHGARVNSYYESVIRVPLFLRVPPAWRKANPEQWSQLQSNAKHLTSHTDIAPTLLDVSGLLPRSATNREQLLGRGIPWTSQSADNRNAFMVVRTGSRLTPGFFVMARDHWRLGVSELRGGIKAFNLKKDPKQQNDLWPDGVPDHIQHALRTAIQEHSGLRVVYRSCVRNDCDTTFPEVIESPK